MRRLQNASGLPQAVLGVGFVGSLLLVVALFTGALSSTADAPQCNRSFAAAVKYIHSGRLAADLSTARYMVKYLLEPEVSPNPQGASCSTNQSNQRPSQLDGYGTIL